MLLTGQRQSPGVAESTRCRPVEHVEEQLGRDVEEAVQVEVLAVVVAGSAGGDLVEQAELDLAVEAGARHAVGEELEQGGEDPPACAGLAGGDRRRSGGRARASRGHGARALLQRRAARSRGRAGSRGRRGWPGAGAAGAGGEDAAAASRAGPDCDRATRWARASWAAAASIAVATWLSRPNGPAASGNEPGVDPVGDHDLAERQQRGEQRAQDGRGVARVRGEHDEAAAGPAGPAGGPGARTGCATISSARDRERRVARDRLLDGSRGDGGGGERAGEQLAGDGCERRGERRGGGGEARGRQPRLEAGALPVEPGIEHRPG